MVDNNSTDNSIKVIMKYPRIKLLSEKKQGSYAARNRGVAESKGSIIAFTDSDCIPVPEWLDRISASLDSPSVGIIQGGRLYTTESRGLLLLEAYESERAFYTFSGKLKGLYYGYTNNMAVRRGVFDRCGPFLEVMRGADSIFVNRAIEEYSSEIIRYVPDAAIRHLEITKLRDYLGKRFIYGKSFRTKLLPKKEERTGNMTVFERYRYYPQNWLSDTGILSSNLFISLVLVFDRHDLASVRAFQRVARICIRKGPSGSL